MRSRSPAGTPGPWSRTRIESPAVAALDADVDARALRTIAHGVAQHVLDRAAQQFAVAVYGAARGRPELDVAILGGALEIRVAHDLLDHFVDVERLAVEPRLGAVQSRELENLADQAVEPLDLALHAVELPRRVRRRLAREADGEAHARERRAQFMRDIAQQPGERARVGAQLVGHRVEVAASTASSSLRSSSRRSRARRGSRRPARARPPGCVGSARSGAARATSWRTR